MHHGLEYLLDRRAILDLVTAYTVAVDTRSWADLADVFTADAVLDYTSTGGPVGPPDEVIGWIEQGLAGFVRYQHVLGQVGVDLGGAGPAVDRAQVKAYFTNPLVALRPDGTEQLFEVGGYYHHEMIRTPQGWRSRHLVDEVVWTRGF